MPRAVAETGAVDLVLAPEEIGPALADRMLQDDMAGSDHAPDIREGEGRILTRILELVLGGANVDFSEYKKSTVMRRIARRMQNAGLRALIDYLDEVERNPAEARALANDLLIVVSEFFRDPGVWDLLAEQVIPELIVDPSEDRPIRVWVPAVATGQEAYSLAMLLREAADRMGREPRVQIFATDVNPIALEKAAAGIYSEQDMANVSAGRREAFFSKTEDGHWQVGPEIRNWIVFAPHNMLRDPPFINTDLISCRNALIYFEGSAQQKALSLFHFSLAPSGFLLLGPSESIGDDQARFAVLDSKWRLFRKRQVERREVTTVSDLISRNRWTTETPTRRRAAPYGAGRAPNAAALQTVLDLYAPPGFLIGRDRELLHVVGTGRDYLDAPQAGPFSQDVVKLAREPLRIPLATGIERALRSGEEVVFTSGNPNRKNGETAEIVFRVHPIRGEHDGPTDRLFISFGSAPIASGDPAQVESVNFDRLAEQRISYLEDALRAERENLQSMLEQLETSNEELQSTNEELMTANEELQSTNEELHSVNEELYTVNAEYERKNEELTQLSKDVTSLLQATGVGVVFVDRGLLVRRFTPTATRVVNLIPGDEGRHLSHITHRLTGFDFCAWLERAMATGELLEEQRPAEGGSIWTVRAAPVKDGRVVSGAVVSLIEVTHLVEAEAEARSRTAELQQLLSWVGAVSLQFSGDGAVVRSSGEWAAFTGQDFETIRDSSADGWLDIVHPEDAPRVKKAWRAAHNSEKTFDVAARLTRPGGGWRPAVIAGGPQPFESGGGYFVYIRDAAEAAGARREAAESDRHAAALAELAFAGAYTLRPAANASDLDARLAALVGLSPGRHEIPAFEAMLAPAGRREWRAALAARDAQGGRWSAIVQILRGDAPPALFRDQGLTLAEEDGQGPVLVGGLTALDGDAADGALAAEILRKSPVQVLVLDAESRKVLSANPSALSGLGYSEDELTGMRFERLSPDYDADSLSAALAPLRDGAQEQIGTTAALVRKDGSSYAVDLSFKVMAGGARIAAVARPGGVKE
jgi:two-component system CheB/CheR fusion protein